MCVWDHCISRMNRAYEESQVWYTSLAFGGFRSDSKADVQRAHLLTEDMMRECVHS